MPFLQESYSPEILILLMLFLFFGLVQLLYIWVLNSRIAFMKTPAPQGSLRPVSIVICAKDEYHNLKETLPLILHQDYPDFEVIVVNDASEDETNYLLEDLQKDYPHLKPVTINSDLNFFKGKKFPLSIGIKSAHKPYLLLTDADCRPSSRHWLRLMQDSFTEDRTIVLGYGAYRTGRSLLHTLIRFDTVITAMRYLSWARAGIPYMGVGRNLAYHKDLFFREGGFHKHYRVTSGDDDLFINRVADRKNTAIQLDQDAFTYSKAADRTGQWIRQKRRHLTTGSHYRGLHKFLLGFEWFSAVIFYALFAILLVLRVETMLVSGVFGLRLLSFGTVFKKSMMRLREKDLLVLSPILEVFFILFNPALALSNKIFRNKKWK